MSLRRHEIDLFASVIRALAYRNIREMEGQPDEAIYELDRVLGKPCLS